MPPSGKPVKLGNSLATPTLPAPGVAVQQWMCAWVTLPVRPAKFTCTRIVRNTSSVVTVVKPVPAEITGGDSAAPLRTEV